MKELEEKIAKCEICGEPMPIGEEMFKFHGYSGKCPKPPLPIPVIEKMQTTDYGSQPNKWRLAAEKRCSFCQETGKMFGNVRVDIVSGLYQSIPCHRCKGAGTITHTLTNDEVGELVQHYTNELRQVSPGCFTRGLFLPSGERVILLPEKEK